MKAVHLAIDCVDTFLSYLPRPGAFGAAARIFAADLRQNGISTIWTFPIGFKDECRLFNDNHDDFLHKYFRQKYAFHLVWPEKGAEFLAKYANSVFFPGYNFDLTPVLRARKIDTLIVSGIRTSQCVAQTVKSALGPENGFNVVAIYDLIADDTLTDLGAHQNKTAQRLLLEEKLGSSSASPALRFATRGECLASLEKGPTP